MCQRFGYDKILHATSGTEAVESACKIARKWGIQIKGIPAQEALILGVSGCYHGFSTAMWSLQDPSTKRDGKSFHKPEAPIQDTLHGQNTKPLTVNPESSTEKQRTALVTPDTSISIPKRLSP